MSIPRTKHFLILLLSLLLGGPAFFPRHVLASERTSRPCLRALALSHERDQFEGLFQQLLDLKEGFRGEIRNGILYVEPPGAGNDHQETFFQIIAALGQFNENRKQPADKGGWLIRPEIQLKLTRKGVPSHAPKPDILGWRTERLAKLPSGKFVTLIPDWICEIVSDDAKKDRVQNKIHYKNHRLKYYWIVDPMDQTIEIYELRKGNWVNTGNYSDNDVMRARPFDDIEIDCGRLWL
jgi:Uma2 family endonuclease